MYGLYLRSIIAEFNSTFVSADNGNQDDQTNCLGIGEHNHN